jgi:hypothetical protein
VKLKLLTDFVLEHCKFAKLPDSYLYESNRIEKWLKSDKGKAKLEAFAFTIYENCQVSYVKHYPRYLNKKPKDITLEGCRVRVPRRENGMVQIYLIDGQVITIQKRNRNFEIWCNDRLVLY